jgi:Cyclin, N-terminal domain/Cyclin, C-terminal domain/F-box-like
MLTRQRKRVCASPRSDDEGNGRVKRQRRATPSTPTNTLRVSQSSSPSSTLSTLSDLSLSPVKLTRWRVRHDAEQSRRMAVLMDEHMLASVLSHLDEDDLARASSVCRKWRQVGSTLDPTDTASLGSGGSVERWGVPRPGLVTLRNEQRYRLDASYLDRQPHLNARMRRILVDWMFEVSDEFAFCFETLFLAVGSVDRFLACSESVRRGALQLLGVSCLWIANKYESVALRPLEHYVMLCDGLYSREQVVDMERVVLQTLEFRFTVRTSIHFVHTFLLRLAPSDAAVASMARYAACLCMLDHTAVGHPPSLVAVVCVAVAHLVVVSGRTHRPDDSWLERIARVTGYDPASPHFVTLLRAVFLRVFSRSASTVRLAMHQTFLRADKHGVAAFAQPSDDIVERLFPMPEPEDESGPRHSKRLQEIAAKSAAKSKVEHQQRAVEDSSPSPSSSSSSSSTSMSDDECFSSDSKNLNQYADFHSQ